MKTILHFETTTRFQAYQNLNKLNLPPAIIKFRISARTVSHYTKIE